MGQTYTTAAYSELCYPCEFLLWSIQLPTTPHHHIMSSWADIAAKNAPPPELEGHPDPNLLEGEHHAPGESDMSSSAASDDKVHVVTRDEFEIDSHPAEDDHRNQGKLLSADGGPGRRTTRAGSNTSNSGNNNNAHSGLNPAAPTFEISKETKENLAHTEKDVKKVGESAKKDAQEAGQAIKKGAQQAGDSIAKGAQEAKKEASEAAQTVKRGAANATAEPREETKENLAQTEKDVKKAGREIEKDVKKGAAKAEKTWEQGKESAKAEYDELSEKAKGAYNKLSKEAQEDWHKLSKKSKEEWQAAKNSDLGKEIQKPEVWGSMLGVANLAVIGSVAFYTYANWHKPRWDRRVVSATVVAVSAWFGLQGYLIPQTDAVRQNRK